MRKLINMYLITGGTGFIGNRLCKSLVANNMTVRLLARKPVANHDTILCDLSEESVPVAALDSVDTIFHLAAYSHDLHNGSKHKADYYRLNLNATIKLANLAAKNGVRKFVFISSVKAAGQAVAGRQMRETEQGEPEGIYAASKREAEIKLLDLGGRTDMAIAIVRPAPVYGPGMKGSLNMMLKGIRQGWFPPLPDVKNCRSMIHVDDLVRVLLLVAEEDRTDGEIYNATDGNNYSSRNIYETLYSTLNKKIPSWQIPKVIFDFLSLFSPGLYRQFDKLFTDECYSSEKLQALGFKPKFSLINLNDSIF